ncbi:GH25 family lysozyme [Amycolatopsis sp. NPDC088138]|uniref:GH25 family lysozyme n=1 Tax=Amycolatopsis sp. NPDC088138 TaxID=3363938 RepID=UPI00380C7825
MASGLGVDVHPYYQRGARFDGVEYAWLKMTDGAAVYAKKVDGVWYTTDEHARLLRLQRTPFGGYVYAQPGDGAAEARVLWGECQRLGGTGVAPACDIESNKDIHVWSPGEAADHGRAFCSWFRARGIRPAIYMGAAFANTVRPDLWPENPVVWIARYGAKPEAAGAGHYGGRYDVHQYSSSGTLPGSAGAVDWNQSYNNNHLTSPTGGFMSGFNGDDFASLMWGNVFDATGSRNFAQFVKDMDAKLTGLGTSLGAVTKLLTDSAAHPVDAQQLADALEGKLVADLVPAVTQAVAQAAGEEAADEVRKMLVAKLGG